MASHKGKCFALDNVIGCFGIMADHRTAGECRAKIMAIKLRRSLSAIPIYGGHCRASPHSCALTVSSPVRLLFLYCAHAVLDPAPSFSRTPNIKYTILFAGQFMVVDEKVL